MPRIRVSRPNDAPLHLGPTSHYRAEEPNVPLSVDTQTPLDHTHLVDIPAGVTSDLVAVAYRTGATLSAALLAAFGVLLSRYVTCEDITVGVRLPQDSSDAAAANRELAETLVRIDLSGNPTFVELLDRMRASGPLTCEPDCSSEFSRVTLIAPQEWLAAWRSVSNIAETDGAATSGAATDRLEFSCAVEPHATAHVAIAHSGDLFGAGSITRLGIHFTILLQSIVCNAGTPILQLELLSPLERRSVLAYGIGKRRGRAVEGCLHERFVEQAKRTPNASAICDDLTTLTYRELNDRTDRLAGVLTKRGAVPGTLVGLLITRSVQAVVGMLAVLKTGAAYVPLDPELPAERIAFMLEDAEVALLCGDPTKLDSLPAYRERFVDLQAAASLDSARNIPAPTHHRLSPTQPAYVMYTSGSTGRPKGVIVPHRAVTNLVVDPSYVRIEPADTVSQTATLSFDVSTFEVWGALLNGARLVICPTETVRSPAAFAAFLQRRHVSVMLLATAIFHAVVRTQPQAFSRMRALMVLGEALDPQSARAVFDAGPPQRLLNTYGPTETTSFSCSFELSKGDCNAKRIPIGRPIIGTQTYVLDRFGAPLPFGIPGELCIGGTGVADGYLGRPALTAERFICDPNSEDSEARLYCTGDRVRLMPTGALDILGRFDDQVKVRGFRVELGEVEAALRHQPAVRAAVVIADGEGDGRRLVAYVVLRSAPSVTDGDLKTALRKTLPAYMVPSSITFIGKLPLNANGKIDKRALPRALKTSTAAESLPQNPVQRQLVAIWQRILAASSMGIHDDFFELGGTSLLAVRMLDEIEHTLGKSVPPAELFTRPTISHLAEVLHDQARKNTQSVIVLQDAGDKTPFFLFHGATEPAFYGRKLSLALPWDQPFYVLVPHGFNDATVPPTIEAQADDYLALIRSVRPTGPYHVGGFCMAGQVAFEAALRLTNAAERVDNLILIDGFPRAQHLSWLEAILCTCERYGVTLWRRQRILAAVVRWRNALSIALHGDGTCARLRQDLNLRATMRGILANDAPQADRVHWLQTVARSYVPRRYPGRVSVLASATALASFANDPSVGLKNVCAGVDLYPVPGTHNAILTEQMDTVIAHFRTIFKAA